MKQSYIKIPAIYKKLRLAEESGQPLYLSAPVGYGKTAAVQHFCQRKQTLWLSGESGYLDKQAAPEEISQKIIVIDDITWLTEESSRAYVNELLEKGIHQIIMMGRAALPEWLKAACLRHRFLLADRRDLELNAELAEKLLETFQLHIPENEIEDILLDSKGNALCIIVIAYQLQKGGSYSRAVWESASQDMFDYFNRVSYEKWSEEMKELLQAMANFPCFTVELAEMVTGSKNVARLLLEAREVGDFFTIKDGGCYEMLKLLRQFFLWKQALEGRNNKIKEIFTRAALYYELRDELPEALDCYEKAGNTEAVSKLLIRNAEKHPGTGHYFETRKYYLSLSEEELEKSPVLMAGMSMLYSLLLQPERSEEWFSRLQAYEKRAEGRERREAKRRLIYLGIALPHRGSGTMIDILKRAAVLLTDKKQTIPEFSVTSNLPSILNGGKDFSEWSLSDRELARVMKKPVELILGKWGAGLVNIALAESLFEKGEPDIYEIMTLLNSGYTKADLGGKIEMCFVATAVMCRLHLCRNQMQVARTQLQDFAEKAKREEAGRLHANIRAMQCGFELMAGNLTGVRCWLEEEAPKEQIEFYILNRYQYLIKVRAYLALEQFEEALNLTERLSVYFREYHRTYQDMENEVLKAILQYRMKIGDWQNTLTAVLPRIERYHFLYLIGREGAAIRPLLQELDTVPVKPEFEAKLRKMINHMAVSYPNYLKKQSEWKDELTDAEKQLLHLYCQGLEAKEICELCSFSYNTLKFHNRNLYRKLGVNSRQEAERRARELKL